MSKRILCMTVAGVLWAMTPAGARQAPQQQPQWLPVASVYRIPPKTFEAPRILGVDPARPSRSDREQMLQINGENFAPGLKLALTPPSGAMQSFSGSAVEPRNDQAFRITVVLKEAGNYALVVTNPDGASSSAFTMSVVATPTTAPPAIDRVLPDSPAHDQQPQTLTLMGRNFVQGLSVTITDPIGQVTTLGGRATSDVSESSLRVSVVLDKAGQYQIAVINPSGQTSNAVTVNVS